MNRANRDIYDAVVSNGAGVGLPERVVELRHMREIVAQEKTAPTLDVGCAHAMACHRKILYESAVVPVVGIDLARPGWLVRRTYDNVVKGNVCNMPFPDDHFGVVLCISTLEHIGFDNSGYGIGKPEGTQEDALREMMRVLRPNGRLLVTVPVGASREYPGFRQFDFRGIQNLVGELLGLDANVEVEMFRHVPGWGWRSVYPKEITGLDYYEGSNGGAAAVAILVARKMSPHKRKRWSWTESSQ